MGLTPSDRDYRVGHDNPSRSGGSVALNRAFYATIALSRSVRVTPTVINHCPA